MAISEDDLRCAEEHGHEQRQAGYAIKARYDRRRSRVVVTMNTGLELTFPAHHAKGLAQASAEDRARIEITPNGLGLHWPTLDVDLYIPGLLAGTFGSPRSMAAHLGAKGGRSRSAAKARASRANGRLGGRPAHALPPDMQRVRAALRGELDSARLSPEETRIFDENLGAALATPSPRAQAFAQQLRQTPGAVGCDEEGHLVRIQPGTGTEPVRDPTH